MLLEKSRKIALEGMKRLSQSGHNTQIWICLVVKVKFDAVNENGKLEVVKQEMTRVNIDILGNRTKMDRSGQI